MEINLKTKIGNLTLKNPILTASGTFGYGLEFAKKMDISSIGGIITKGLSPQPRDGNQMPRICEVSGGMLNAIGLQNIGIDAFIQYTLPQLQKTGATVIANFFGESEEEYISAARRLSEADGVHALEMNVSCPNVKKGGIQFGTDPDTLGRLTDAVRKATKKPLIVKLSPNVTNIKPFARRVEDAGADAISAINTLIGMKINIKTGKPVLANRTGGLSGPAIKPVAIRMVYEIATEVKIPIIGIGGIAALEDVIEFLMAGATAVQIGTWNFIEPNISQRLVSELQTYLKDNSLKDTSSIIAKAHQ